MPKARAPYSRIFSPFFGFSSCLFPKKFLLKNLGFQVEPARAFPIRKTKSLLQVEGNPWLMLSMLHIFTRFLSKPAIPHQNPASAVDELQTIDEEYIAAERAFSKACYAVLRYQQEHREAGSLMFINAKAYNRVNGAALNPELARLCSLREEARQRRSLLLTRRADALRRAGKVR